MDAQRALLDELMGAGENNRVPKSIFNLILEIELSKALISVSMLRIERIFVEIALDFVCSS